MEDELYKKRLNRLYTKINRHISPFLLLILAIALVVRLSYLYVTFDQPLWWDEADYMNIARAWAGESMWEFNPLRPVLFPLILRFFLLFGLGELFTRFFLVGVSLLGIFFFYKTAELLLKKNSALMATFLFSFFWSPLFYTFRILVDGPIITLTTAAIYITSYSYLKEKSWKHFVASGVLIGLAFLLKFSAIFLVGMFAVYFLTTEKTKVIKNKKLWTLAAATFLTVLPYLLWQYFAYGDPIKFYNVARNPEVLEAPKPFLDSFFVHLMHALQNIFNQIDTALFLVGLAIVLLSLVIMWDKAFKKGSATNKKYLLLLWFLVGLAFFGNHGYSENGYLDERLHFIFYPSMFMMAGLALENIYGLIKKYQKEIAIVLVLFILGISAYQNITRADETINSREQSFTQIRKAGEFVNERISEGDSVIVAEMQAELTYYISKGNVHYGSDKYPPGGYFTNRTTFYQGIEDVNPGYVIVPLYYYLNEQTPQKVELLQEIMTNQQNFTFVKGYEPFIDQNRMIPLVSVYKVN